MSQFHSISTMSLCLASVLVIISMFMSYRQELKLEKDIFISALRATIQLFVIGFMLIWHISSLHIKKISIRSLMPMKMEAS